MKISYNWLSEYINPLPPAEALSKILTSIGLEVENLEKHETIRGGLKGIVTGRVLECSRIPETDHLSITRVDTGNGEPLQIVCGAPNVAAGQNVVVALPGTTLYQGEKSFVIKKTKIKGFESNGMICAEDEIGTGTSHDGVIVLPPDVKPGIPASEYYNIQTDYIFEIGLTPNRIDAASHFGVARDVAAFMSLNGGISLSRPSADDFRIDNEDLPVEVIIENAEACRRYCGITISGVKVEESPEWLKNKLKSIGLHPINNIVDITNFVLHETGQPLHAFDTAMIEGKTVVVKTLPEGTPFTTLDGIERTLAGNDLMICNQKEGMCIAGVFGGIRSGVTEATTSVFLESAWFDPGYIRRTSRRLALFTDASFRFERGADIDITIYALKRAAMLIKSIAGGKISSRITDVFPNPLPPVKVKINIRKVQSLLGKDIPAETMMHIMESLDMRILQRTEEQILVEVPHYRTDVTREADVAEEILRIYGYNNIDISAKMHSSLSYSVKPDPEKMLMKTGDFLAASGFNEIMLNSLTPAGYYQDLTSYPENQSVRLINPLSSDLNCLRQTLLFGGLETIAYNTNRKNSDLKLFEFGNCYFLKPENKKNPLDKYEEYQRLGIWITGKNIAETWKEKQRETHFFDLKQTLEQLFIRLGISNRIGLDTSLNMDDIFSQGIRFTGEKKMIGYAAVVHNNMLKKFDLKNPVFYAELYWNEILKLVARNQISFSELPRFPEVRRDLALLIDNNITFDAVKKIAQSTEKTFLRHVNLFDVFEDEKLGKGKKSYAVSFIFRDDTRTLTDDQVDKMMERLVKAYETSLGAQIR